MKYISLICKISIYYITNFDARYFSDVTFCENCVRRKVNFLLNLFCDKVLKRLEKNS